MSSFKLLLSCYYIISIVLSTVTSGHFSNHIENFSFANNPDGTVNVIGNTTNNIVGTFPNIEVASQEALNVTKQNSYYHQTIIIGTKRW